MENIVEAFVCPHCGQAGYIIMTEHGMHQYCIVDDTEYGGITVGDEIHSDTDITTFKCGSCYNEITIKFDFDCVYCGQTHRMGDSLEHADCLEQYLVLLAERENENELA